MTSAIPRIGVGVFVVKNNKILLRKRTNAHGHRTWEITGGHLEFNETPEQCAIREVKEETGMEIKNVRFATLTNDIFEKEKKHYITLYMVAEHASGLPRILEPDKCEGWEWFNWEELPEPLFLPIENLRKTQPFFHPLQLIKQKEVYQHYKGGLYQYLHAAQHSETHEELVVYKNIDPKNPKVWVRPKEMFFDTVLQSGQPMPRFMKKN